LIHSDKRLNALSALGSMSYEIYLWHMFSYLIIGLFTENFILKIVLSVTLTFVFAVLFCKIRIAICKKG